MTATTDPATDAAPLPDHAVVPAVWSRITNLDVDRGEGSWLITRDGTRYLDYSSGIGVTNTGHAHPRVAAAIAAQAAKLLHGQQNIVYHEPGLRLYERLQHVLPGGPWQAFLSNSGAEAVEASVKLARVATGRPVILAFRGGFHGRTAQTMALTTAKDTTVRPSSRCRAASTTRRSRTAIGRPAGRTIRRPAPATGRRSSTCSSTRSSIRRRSRRSSSSRSSARAATSSRRRRSCRASARSPGSTASCSSPTRSRPASGGPARCSRCEHWDVEPDILVMAKGIASGLPLSGILARTEIMDALEARHPRRHVRRQRRLVRGGQRHARRHRGRGPRRQRPRARRAARSAGCASCRRTIPAIGDVRGLGLHGRDGVRPAGRRRRAGARRGPDQAGHRRGARPQADRPVGRVVRQRHPDHPAARHDRRRGRPGARRSSTRAWPPPAPDA